MRRQNTGLYLDLGLDPKLVDDNNNNNNYKACQLIVGQVATGRA